MSDRTNLTSVGNIQHLLFLSIVRQAQADARYQFKPGHRRAYVEERDVESAKYFLRDMGLGRLLER